jgi:hypothetical protein
VPGRNARPSEVLMKSILLLCELLFNISTFTFYLNLN